MIYILYPSIGFCTNFNKDVNLLDEVDENDGFVLKPILQRSQSTIVERSVQFHPSTKKADEYNRSR